MLWVALGTLLMVLTGSGDDTKAIRERADLVRKSVKQIASDQARATRAVQSVDDFEKVFGEHRDRLEEIGKCVEEADRRYEVSEADYNGCLAELDKGWDLTIEGTLQAQRNLRDALTDSEWQSLRERLAN